MSRFFDAMYGSMELPRDLESLIRSAAVQRLRGIRLSNIDSIDMPGIANISRFGHSLGVAYLASQTAIFRTLRTPDQRLLCAAALLHDWAISPFGHLVEEAFVNSDIAYDHEKKLGELNKNSDSTEIGGTELQLFYGRQAGISEWVLRNFDDPKDAVIKKIDDTIGGRGSLGPLISAPLDLDNLDNVFRMAYHMGLRIAQTTPVKLARQIVGVQEGAIVLDIAAKPLMNAWLDLRSNVYSRLMPARRDFVGKSMLLHAAMRAVKMGVIKSQDWTMTDDQFITALTVCHYEEVSEPIKRWLTGDLWPCSRLLWLKSEFPSYANCREYSDQLKAKLGRKVLVHTIKDKRFRRFKVRFSDGRVTEVGRNPDGFLLAVLSDSHKVFSTNDETQIYSNAATFFEADVILADEYFGDTHPGLF